MKKKINTELCTLNSNGEWKLKREACIEACDKRYEVYRADSGEKYARVDADGKIVEFDIETSDFKAEVRNFLRKASGLNDIDNRTVKSVLGFLSDKAVDGEKKTLASRAYYDANDNCVFIDVCDGYNVIRISKDEIEKIQRPLAMFQEYASNLPLADYVDTEAAKVPELIQKVTRLKYRDAVILTTYMVACLYGNSKPVPILFITGPQGSAKTTLSRLIQNCIDPSIGGMFCLSDSLKDLAIATSKRMLCVFDNTGGLKNKKKLSDLLCTVVTKGSMQTRTLYTTKDETILKFRSSLVINGIDFLADQTDLLERCLMLELEAIPEKERKTERQLENDIKKILPQLLGGLYDIIQKTLTMEDEEVNGLNRMADYEMLAIKAAKAIGVGTEQFQGMLNENIRYMQEAFSLSDITAKAIILLMEDRTEYIASATDLHLACYDMLTGKVLKSEQASFPKSASAFTARLRGLEKVLRNVGITVTFKATNKCTMVTVSRMTKEVEDGSTEE